MIPFLRPVSIGGLLLVAALIGLAAEASPDAYLDWLEREKGLVTRAQQACAQSKGEELGSLRQAMDLARRAGPGLDPAGTGWLVQDGAQVLAAPPGERLPLLRRLLARIEAYRRAAALPAGNDPDPAEVRARLAKVLARGEFGWRPTRLTWFERARNWVNDTLRRLLYTLFESGIAFWLLVSLAVVATAVLLVLAFGALRGRPGTAGWARAPERLEPEEVRAGKKQDLKRLADQAYREGKFRDALRLLYVAHLRDLDRAGVIRLVPHKTNWDYRREIEGNRRELAAAFGLLTDLYEAKWYGREPCGAEHYDEALRLFDAAEGVAR
ncbi:MAG: DUF4129 domain-containing protein [Bacteroidota bacterium]